MANQSAKPIGGVDPETESKRDIPYPQTCTLTSPPMQGREVAVSQSRGKQKHGAKKRRPRKGRKEKKRKEKTT